MVRGMALAGLLAAVLLANRAAANIRDPGSSVPPMMFAHVQPASAAPGEEVTITGLQFMQGARVWLGGVEATDIRVETGERIVATVPDHPPGNVSVMIRDPDGREVSRARSFTYVQR